MQFTKGFHKSNDNISHDRYNIFVIFVLLIYASVFLEESKSYRE